MTTIAEIRQKFPMYSDLSDGEFVRGLHKKFYSDIPYSDFLKKVDFRESVDPTKGMGTGEKVLAGAGKAFVDIGRGVSQIAGVTPQTKIDEAKALDAPLMNTGAGVAGNILGNAAAFVPTAAIPGANTYIGAGLIGSAMGAIQPVATGDSRVSNSLLGGSAGVAGQAIGRGVGRVLRPVQGRLSPEEQALAQVANAEGIPLTAGAATGSRPLQVMESVMENLPLTSGPQLAGKEAQQRAFTQAVLRRGGINADAATPQVLNTQRQALGNRLEQIASQHTLDFNQGPIMGRLTQIYADAGHRGQTAAEPVQNMINSILSEVGPNGQMPGQAYQAWRQTLRPLSRSGGADAHLYGQIRSALDDAFNSQIQNPAWRQANREYANLKTIMQAAGGPGATAATNQIAPSQLSAAVRQAMGKEGVSAGRGDLNELSRVGQAFVKDQIPNSGTAQRQFMQNLVSGNIGNLGGGLAGAGVGYYGGETPEAAALGGVLGVGAGLLSPRVIQVLMNSPAGQSYLRNGLMNVAPGPLNALSTGGALALPAGALANY